jgi:hypothetical protein
MQSMHIITNVASSNPAQATLCDKFCQLLATGDRRGRDRMVGGSGTNVSIDSNLVWWFSWFMVFYATFNNISVIS